MTAFKPCQMKKQNPLILPDGSSLSVSFIPLPADPGSSAGLLVLLVQSHLMGPGLCSGVESQEAGHRAHWVGQGAEAGVFWLRGPGNQ